VAAFIEKAGHQLQDLEVWLYGRHDRCGASSRGAGLSRWAIRRAKETAPQSIHTEVMGNASCEVRAVLVFKKVEAAAIVRKLKGAAWDVLVAEVCHLKTTGLFFFARADSTSLDGSSRDINTGDLKAKALKPGSVCAGATPYLQGLTRCGCKATKEVP